MNGCDYVFTIGNTVAADKYALAEDIVCPPGKSIEVHVYLAKNNSNTPICTLTIKGGQALAGATVETTTTASPHDLDLTGALTGIHIEKHGLCGSSTTTKGEFHLDVTVKGTNKTGENTGVTVTES